MNIVIAGGTGFIGRALCQSLVDRQHHVSVLTRNRREAALVFGSPIKLVEWDGRTAGMWQAELKAVDAVINLAGAPIAEGRWTEVRKRLIWESRIDSTRLLADALRINKKRPCTLINASGIGYYGAADARVLDEDTGPGSGFLADLCVAWEQESRRAEEFGVRVVRMRFGMVLGPDGGALPKMLLPFRFFLGGPVLPGTQWVSWIHRRDLIGLIQWALKTPTIHGAVNAVSLEPETMKDFCRTLGKVLHRPSWVPVPGWTLHIALGEVATVMTTGQRAAPAVAVRNDFTYLYPSLEPALRSLVNPDSGLAPRARAAGF